TKCADAASGADAFCTGTPALMARGGGVLWCWGSGHRACSLARRPAGSATWDPDPTPPPAGSQGPGRKWLTRRAGAAGDHTTIAATRVQPVDYPGFFRGRGD